MLLKLDLPYDGNPNPESRFTDNLELPSFLFILGFVLGDGCVIIRIRLVAESGALNFVPILDITQKITELNEQLSSLISASLKANQIPSTLALKKRVTSSLRVEGLNAGMPHNFIAFIN
jgi:hypothetical protein